MANPCTLRQHDTGSIAIAVRFDTHGWLIASLF
jgi:hypothetical protein